MIINNRIFYKFYSCNIDYEIKKVKEDIKVINKSFKVLNSFLKGYKPYLKKKCPLNFADIFSYKNKSLELLGFNYEIIDGVKYNKEACLMYYKKAYNSYWSLKKSRKELKNLKESKITYTIYNKIIKKFNLKICEAIVKRQYEFNMGFKLGVLKAVCKILKKAPVDWKASNINKQRLLKENKIPYLKKDHEKAIKEGREYKGVKWLVKRNPKDVWINYFAPHKGRTFKFELTKNVSSVSLKTILNNFKKTKYFNKDDYQLIENGNK